MLKRRVVVLVGCLLTALVVPISTTSAVPTPSEAPGFTDPPAAAPANAFAYRGTGGYIAGWTRNVSSDFTVFPADPSTVSIEVDGFTLMLKAPGTSALAVGSYLNAVRYPFNGVNEPGISFYGNGRGCNTVTGEFFIDDIAFTGSTMTRLATRWVHRCEGFSPPEYGWVTYNTNTRYGWIGAEVATTQVPVGVTRQLIYRNTGNGPTSVGLATLEGDGFGFASGQNTCTGVVLAAGATCTVGLRFGQTSTPVTAHTAGTTFITSSNNGGARVTLDGLAVPAGDVVPIAPFRLVDTRENVGTTGALGMQETRTVTAGGRGGIPSSGAIGIMATVVGVTPTADTWLTAWATGRAKPQTSNVNPRAGKVTTNFAFIPLSSSGQFDLFNALGSTNVVIDVMGWVSGDVQPTGSRVLPITPARTYDSRAGDGALSGSRRISVVASGMPANATAAIMNIAVASPTQSSWFNVTAAGDPRPFTAVMNFEAGEVLSSLVVSKISAFGEVDVFNQAGSADVVIDVVGYLVPTASSSGDAGRVLFVTPGRTLDTRDLGGPISGDQTLLSLANQAGAFVNVSVTSTTSSGWLTLYSSPTRPNVASINWPSGATRGNLQLIRTGTTRAFVSSGVAHVIVDSQVLISDDTL